MIKATPSMYTCRSSSRLPPCGCISDNSNPFTVVLRVMYTSWRRHRKAQASSWADIKCKDTYWDFKDGYTLRHFTSYSNLKPRRLVWDAKSACEKQVVIETRHLCYLPAPLTATSCAIYKIFSLKMALISHAGHPNTRWYASMDTDLLSFSERVTSPGGDC